MNRKGAKKISFSGTQLLVGVLIVVVIGLAWKMGYIDKALNAVGDGSDNGGNDDGNDQFAQVQTSITASAKDVYNDTLAAGTGTAYINGKKTSFTLGTALTIPEDSTVELLFDDGQHYNARLSTEAPANGNGAEQLEQLPNGTLTSVFFNSAGTASTAQAVVADEEKKVKVQFSVASKKVFSHSDSDKNPILCFNYNTTEIDSMVVVDSPGSPKVPQQGQSTEEECWFAPFKSLKDNSEYTISVVVNTDDTVNPASPTDPVLTVYDIDLYTKTRTDGSGTAVPGNVGDRVFGVENDAGTDIGGVNPTVTIDLS
jgi:hypothetical protein